MTMPLSDWFKHRRPTQEGPKEGKRTVPGGIWSKCANCGLIIYQRDILDNFHVCPECDHHFPPSPDEWISTLLETDTWVEQNAGLSPQDPLGFIGRKPYRESLDAAMAATGGREGIITGLGRLADSPVALGVMDFRFIAGSMGSVVGEKITRLFEKSTNERLPIIIIAASGGARMQEGMFSLMQMAKTAAAVGRHSRAGLPFISVLTNPTTGGVLASFGTLADIIIAEPQAHIGFAGPRVIQQTLGEELPSGFQRAESLLDHGMVDMVVHRRDLKDKLSTLLGYLAGHTKAQVDVKVKG